MLAQRTDVPLAVTVSRYPRRGEPERGLQQDASGQRYDVLQAPAIQQAGHIVGRCL